MTESLHRHHMNHMKTIIKMGTIVNHFHPGSTVSSLEKPLKPPEQSRLDKNSPRFSGQRPLGFTFHPCSPSLLLKLTEERHQPNQRSVSKRARPGKEAVHGSPRLSGRDVPCVVSWSWGCAEVPARARFITSAVRRVTRLRTDRCVGAARRAATCVKAHRVVMKVFFQEFVSTAALSVGNK